MKFISTLLLSIFIITGVRSQVNNYSISEPIDIPQTGWNKLLQVQNGNTMLFHFEERKGIVVAIFDSTHKTIVRKKHICKVFDINRQDKANMRALFEMNGEAVLLLEQTVSNKNALIMLRINSADASLIEEKIVLQSPSMARETYYHVLKAPNNDKYYILSSENITVHPEDKVFVTEFNANHKLVKQSTINIDGKNFDRYKFLDFQVTQVGNIYVTMMLSQTKISGIHPVYSNYLILSCLTNSDTDFAIRTVKLSDDASPYYVRLTEKDSLLNIVMVDSKVYYNDYGVNSGIHVDMNSLMIEMKTSDWTYNYQWLTKHKVNSATNPDSAFHFHGVPIRTFTDKNGYVNIIYEEYITYNTIEQGRRTMRTTLGNIGVDKYNKLGNEVWGVVLPKQQSMRTYFSTYEILERGYSKALFRHLPEQEYQDQFNSITTYDCNSQVYIFYNDYKQNFNNTAENPGYAVQQRYTENAFQYTDAFYYRMNDNGEVTKNYLFAPSSEDVSISNMLESGDFDIHTSKYATVVLTRQGKKTDTRIAWCRFN